MLYQPYGYQKKCFRSVPCSSAEDAGILLTNQHITHLLPKILDLPIIDDPDDPGDPECRDGQNPVLLQEQQRQEAQSEVESPQEQPRPRHEERSEADSPAPRCSTEGK